MTASTKQQRRWHARLGSATWDSHAWRWALRHEQDKRLHPVLRRGLAEAILREHGQLVSRFDWTKLLEHASGVRVYPYRDRPGGIARATPWLHPWKRRDGLYQIHWAAMDGGIVCAHPDGRPLIAKFLPYRKDDVSERTEESATTEGPPVADRAGHLDLFPVPDRPPPRPTNGDGDAPEIDHRGDGQPDRHGVRSRWTLDAPNDIEGDGEERSVS